MEMDVNQLTQLINGCGFPIVCCGALFWMLNNSFKELTTAINNLGDEMHVFMLELRKDRTAEG